MYIILLVIYLIKRYAIESRDICNYSNGSRVGDLDRDYPNRKHNRIGRFDSLPLSLINTYIYKYIHIYTHTFIYIYIYIYYYLNIN